LTHQFHFLETPIHADWWFGTFFYDFPYIGKVIIPTDELIFFRGVGQPPSNPCFFPKLHPFFVSAGPQGALLAPYCERFPQLLPVVEKLRPKKEPSEAKKEEVVPRADGFGEFHNWLVVWNMNFITFHILIVGNVHPN